MTREKEKEKNMFVMTLFLHTIPRFPFPHAPGFVNWRDYALNTGSLSWMILSEMH